MTTFPPTGINCKPVVLLNERETGGGGGGEEGVRHPSDIHVLVARATKTRQNQVRDTNTT